jgi:hypothetical protein
MPQENDPTGFLAELSEDEGGECDLEGMDAQEFEEKLATNPQAAVDILSEATTSAVVEVLFPTIGSNDYHDFVAAMKGRILRKFPKAETHTMNYPASVEMGREDPQISAQSLALWSYAKKIGLELQPYHDLDGFWVQL